MLNRITACGSLGLLLANAALANSSLALRLECWPQAAALLRGHYIHVALTDQADIPYRGVQSLVSAADALDLVQKAYAELLPPGQRPEFVIQRLPGGPNRYFYVNRAGERTDITELVRQGNDRDTVELIYYVESRRFFGPFAGVIHIRGLWRDGEHAEYRADVYVYPERSGVRFLARHLGLVRRFFDGKTTEMNAVFTDVVRHLCAPPGAGPAAGASPPA